jgi:hypothetical protein
MARFLPAPSTRCPVLHCLVAADDDDLLSISLSSPLSANALPTASYRRTHLQLGGTGVLRWDVDRLLAEDGEDKDLDEELRRHPVQPSIDGLDIESNVRKELWPRWLATPTDS